MQESESCQLRLLDRESLTHVCSMLDPVTVANLSCTCRELRDVSFQNCLWERFSRHRWRHLNADLHARVESPPSLSECQQDKNHAGKKAVGHQIMEPPVDFRSLYANNNGWTPLHLRKTQEWAFSSDHLQYCASRVPASNFCDIAGDALYTLACEQDNGRPSEVAVSLWSTGDRLQAGRMLQTTSSCVEGNCITELAPGIAAVGAISGEVSLHDLRPEAAKSTHPGATWRNGKRGVISDMKYCPYQATLYALQDLDFSSYLQKWDAECGRAVAGASEFMEEWNLACFCVTDQDTGGNEVIAGAVSEPCPSCSFSTIPTLCSHKSAAKAASLCVFDTRAGVSMVQRYSIHHGSLYPVMPCARGNYLFTSHVRAPLAAWDKRQMSHAVYEEEYLGNFPRPETFGEAEVPLPLPTEAVSHQGLHLTTDGDQLMGRAQNGMVWLWDLSSCLGWQQGGPVGSWLQDTQAARMAAQQSQTEYQAGFEQRWPEMLGSIPLCWEGSVDIDLKNSRTCPIIALSGDESTKSIACLSAGSKKNHPAIHTLSVKQ